MINLLDLSYPHTLFSIQQPKYNSDVMTLLLKTLSRSPKSLRTKAKAYDLAYYLIKPILTPFCSLCSAHCPDHFLQQQAQPQSL